MGQAIPQQHPAVVLRSRFTHLRALLAIAMVAIVGLSTAVVILANDSDGGSDTSAVAPSGSIRYGGFNPATGRPDAASLPEQGARSQPGSTRYDGGPEEGSRGIAPAQAPVTRYDGGPEEGTRGIVPPAESSPRYDGGPEEGTRGLGSNPN